MFKSICKAFKVIYFIIVLIVLGGIGYISYLIHPLFIEPSPTIPKSYYADDKISWTFYRDPDNPKVYQKFSLLQDGRNEIKITRRTGDFDIEMLGPILAWGPTQNRETCIITFKKKDIIPREKAKSIFRKAIASGIMNIVDEPISGKFKLVIDIEVGLINRSVSGPDFISSPIAYPPTKWKNRIYWQKLSTLIDRDRQLSPFMAKLTYLKK